MPEGATMRYRQKGISGSNSEITDSGSAILAIGFILTIVSVLADIVGYGTYDEFGVLQALGTIIGVVFIILGFFIKIFSKIWYR